MLGLVCARSADSCGAVAVRGARLGDDAAAAGVRHIPGGVVDDAVGAGLRFPGTNRALGEFAEHGAASHKPLKETLAEAGLEVALEVLELPSSDESSAAGPSQVRCPSLLELDRDPGAWTKFLGGFGTACAPVLVVGTSIDGDTLTVGAETLGLSVMAQQCAAVGTICVFVGCWPDDKDCLAKPSRARLVRLQPHLQQYIAQLVTSLLDATRPRVLAVMRPDDTLMRITAGG